MTKKNINITNILLLLILLIAVGISIVIGIARTQIGLASLPAHLQQAHAAREVLVAGLDVPQALETRPPLNSDLTADSECADTLAGALHDAVSLELDLPDAALDLVALNELHGGLDLDGLPVLVA